MGKDRVAQPPANLQFHPVTPDRWGDLVQLFGERGAYGGCWCMWWRVTRAQFSKNGNKGNKRAIKRPVDSGEPPGILAYDGDQPVAWCSVGPRETYPPLQRSPNLKKVDEEPVWSIVCFYVAKPYRGQGMMTRLLQAAVEYAKKNGARIVEAYPEESPSSGLHGYAGFMGFTSTFRKSGFKEILRRSRRQPIMRYYIERERK